MGPMNLRPLAALSACASLWAALPAPAAAQGTKPPVVTDTDRYAADRIRAMSDRDPVARVLQLLEARKLEPGALFDLASTHPGLVEQAVRPRYKRAIDWLETLPAPELHRIRRGETVIRARDLWRGDEEDRAVSLGVSFGFKEKKLTAVRAGPLEGRVYRVEVSAAGKGDTTEKGTVELAWPSTPERDEESRELLTKHFGARPSASDQGSGAHLPLADGSFEDAGTLGAHWHLEDAVVLGVRTPESDVRVDHDQSLDGSSSMRVYNTDDTRLFHAIVQRVEVAPGMRLVARTHHMTQNVRAEFQQNEGDLYLSMTFEDINRQPVAAPIIDRGRISTHTWEPLEVRGSVPMEAAYVRIAMVAGLSGTTWFDGTTLVLD